MEGLGDDEEEGWEIVVATGGRALHLSLPPNLREDQQSYIADHLPRTAKLQRSRIRTSTANPEMNLSDTRLDIFRSLTEQVTEKRLEHFELTKKVSALREEYQQLEYKIAERKKHATGLGAAIEDLMAVFVPKVTKK